MAEYKLQRTMKDINVDAFSKSLLVFPTQRSTTRLLSIAKSRLPFLSGQEAHLPRAQDNSPHDLGLSLYLDCIIFLCEDNPCKANA